MTTDLATLIAFHTTAATEPATLPTPAPELVAMSLSKRHRREAQREFDAIGLPRCLAVAA